MNVSLPAPVVWVVAQLQKAGFEAYIVGGAVRDVLLGRPTSDWDFTTNATPEQIQRVFPGSFYENEYGTVGVPATHLPSHLHSETPQDALYEVTTFRSDGVYADFRRPEKVEWGKSIEDDLERRDFTINAMAFRIQDAAPFQTEKGEISLAVDLIDPFQGQRDLKEGRIIAVGQASTRFQEDALRMLRAVRLAAQLGFALDQETLVALQSQSSLIQHISWERIRDEFLKLIVTDGVEDACVLLYTTGLLQHILPELVATRGVEQRGHHEHDVWKHSLRACQQCPSTDPIVRFATLLHDIAKPQTQAPLEGVDGEFSFFNHEVVGARVARDIARRFCLSKEDTQRVFTLVRWHMFYYQSDMTDAAIRRFMRRVGVENINDIMALREGDRLGSGSRRTSWRLEEMKERIDGQLHQPMQVRDLVVKGDDVMQLLSVRPGPIVGQVLNALFEEVLDEPEKNNREYLLSRIPEVAQAPQTIATE